MSWVHVGAEGQLLHAPGPLGSLSLSQDPRIILLERAAKDGVWIMSHVRHRDRPRAGTGGKDLVLRCGRSSRRTVLGWAARLGM